MGQSNYLWNDGSSLQTKTFSGKDLGAIGKYALWVEVTNSNGCTSRDSISITVTDNSSIHSIKAESISLYPQPAHDKLNIEIPSSFRTENTWINISTIEGKILYYEKMYNSLNQIPVNNIETGIYLITITDYSTNQTVTLKWVKG